MSDKNNTAYATITEEFKDQNTKHILSKFEFDLYHEEDDKIEKIIRVKRISMPRGGEKWRIMDDNKTIFTIEGSKLSKKEITFLQTVDGFNFIINQAKTGIKSFNSFKVELRKIVEPVPRKKSKKSASKKKK